VDELVAGDNESRIFKRLGAQIRAGHQPRRLGVRGGSPATSTFASVISVIVWTHFSALCQRRVPLILHYSLAQIVDELVAGDNESRIFKRLGAQIRAGHQPPQMVKAGR
jgi:hypothetical protein